MHLVHTGSNACMPCVFKCLQIVKDVYKPTHIPMATPNTFLYVATLGVVYLNFL